MILHTTEVKYLDGYRLALTFNNGESGEVDLERELWGDMFAPLKDKALFATAYHHPDMGTVVWSNGADLSPEFLLDLMYKQRQYAA